MFTSRAEYRLKLRADNADLRLTPLGIARGCVSAERARRFGRKCAALDVARATTAALSARPHELARFGIRASQDGRPRSAAQLLGYPDVDLARLAKIWPELADVPADVAIVVETEHRYAGYLRRQEADIEAFRKDEALSLPGDLDYGSVGGLSTEIRDKLDGARPATLGAASRIAGVTPAALIALLRHVRRDGGYRGT